MSEPKSPNIVSRATPLTGQQAHEIQAFGSIVEMPLVLARETRRESVTNLNQLPMARQAVLDGDDGTNDLVVSNVIRTNELQVWFVAEHAVDGALVRSDGSSEEKK